MTRAAREILEYAHKLDEKKSRLPEIVLESSALVFPDNTVSLFPLYCLTSAFLDDDMVEYEPEAIADLVENDFNSDRVNAAIATTARSDAWVSARAFDIFVDASVGNEINPEVISPDTAEEIAVGLMTLAGIEGAAALPIKTDVVKFIVASLKFDGWTMPPLPLMFSHVAEYFDNSDAIDEIVERYGQLSLKAIVDMDHDKFILSKSTPSMTNYFIRNQEVAAAIIESMNKIDYDNATVFDGA